MAFFGYFLIILLVFGVLIFIHEFGHFITARMCGVTVKEFAIGMGPKAFSWNSKKHGTKYSLRLLPIGGYVSMENEDGLDENAPPDDEGAFCNKSVPKRMLITIAGAVMNLLLGFAKFSDDAISSEKLMVDDEILKVGSTRVHTWNELAYEIMNKGYEPIDITLRRNGERIVVQDVEFFTIEDSGATFGDLDFIPYAEEVSFGSLAKHSFYRSVSTVKMVLDSVKGLLTGRFGMDAVSGPVGVVGVVQEASKQGFMNFLYIIAVLTINLGVFNLIPFPALDGGRFVFLAVEGIMGRPIDRRIESYVNFVGIVILFAFMIVVCFKDIVKLIF